MHYLVFIPNKQAANRQHLVDAGLGELLMPGDETPLCADLIGNGPGDQPGQVWAWGNAVPAYLPDRQDWTPAKSGKFWLGIFKQDPIKPDDLLRKKSIHGTFQRLQDGQDWLIPNCTRVLHVFDMDEAGQVIRVPHKDFRPFVDECDWAAETIDRIVTTNEPSEVDWRRMCSVSVQALQINYRLNLTIALQLGLLGEDDPLRIMARAINRAKLTNAS